jgi:hypothetical protein
MEREGIVGVGGLGGTACGREVGGGGKWGLRGEFAIGGFWVCGGMGWAMF